MSLRSHEVVAGGLNSLKAFERMCDGISHSNSHYAEDEYGIPVLYATQMHRMAKYLVETMNRNRGEYDEFVKRQQEWRNKMRKFHPDTTTDLHGFYYTSDLPDYPDAETPHRCVAKISKIS